MLWLTLAAFVPLISLGGCSFAAMSIDLGSQFIKVGIVKPGLPMDVALNPESRRKTPNMVLLHDGHRTFGDGALAMQVRYPNEVFAFLLDLVGKNKDHPSFKLFSERFPLYDVSTAPRNYSGISFQAGEESYSVETLLAMILASAKKFTEEHAQVPMIKDAVITVPAFFTSSERLALERAAQMANLNVLGLINDGTAAALSHAIFRRKEVTETPQRLLVYDMGASKTTATIVEIKLVKEKYEKQPKMTVLGVGFDRTLGGLEVTLRLRDHLIGLFNKTYKPKADVRLNKRSMAKFFKEAERLKQVLSANADHFAQIESAHEEKDVRLKVTREDLNGLIADLMPRVIEPIEQALRVAQLPIDMIDQVVLMGAGTRVPKIQEAVQKAIGSKELGKFLNTDEAIAMGGLFRAADLSKGFKVKPFNVEEIVLFPVEVNFVSKSPEREGVVVTKDVTKTLFPSQSVYPTKRKTISLTSYESDFKFFLSYGNSEILTKKQMSEINALNKQMTTIEIAGLTKELEALTDIEKADFKGVKVVFELDASGITRVVRADAVIERKEGIVNTIASKLSGLFNSKTEEGEPTESDSTGSNGDEQEEKSTSSPPAATSESSSTNTTSSTEANTNGTSNSTTVELKEKPSVISLKLSTEYPSFFVPNKYDVLEGKKRLTKFAEAEKQAADRAAAENELESFTFESSLLFDDAKFVEFSSEKEREELQGHITRIRAWMEDEVTRETKVSDFTDNLAQLKKIVKSVRVRIEQEKTLPTSVANLKAMLNTTMALASMGDGVDEPKALFDKKDRTAFRKKLDKLAVWLGEIEEKMVERKAFDDFPVTSSQVDAKLKALNTEVDKFMRKMKKTVDLETLAKGGLKDVEEALKEEKKDEKSGDELKKKENKEQERKKTAKEDKDKEKTEL